MEVAKIRPDLLERDEIHLSWPRAEMLAAGQQRDPLLFGIREAVISEKREAGRRPRSRDSTMRSLKPPSRLRHNHSQDLADLSARVV